jgi:hypothetical protein
MKIKFEFEFNEFIKVGAACISMHIMAAHYENKVHLLSVKYFPIQVHLYIQCMFNDVEAQIIHVYIT